jgi:hypothetical protein
MIKIKLIYVIETHVQQLFKLSNYILQLWAKNNDRSSVCNHSNQLL